MREQRHVQALQTRNLQTIVFILRAMDEKRLSLKQQAEQIRKEESSFALPSEQPRRLPTQQPSEKVLEEQIVRYTRRGYRIVHRSKNSVQMVRPKRFSFVWAMVWFFFTLGSGIVVYLAYYLAKTDKTVYIRVEPTGSVQHVGSGGGLSSVFRWMVLLLVSLFWLGITLFFVLTLLLGV